MSQRTTILIVVIVAAIAFALWVVSQHLEEAARLPDPNREVRAPEGPAPGPADTDDARADVPAPARPQLEDPGAPRPATLDPTAAQGLYDDLRAAVDSVGDIGDAATIKEKPAFTLPELERPEPAKDDEQEPEPDPDP